jgi:hypothetical protein
MLNPVDDQLELMGGSKPLHAQQPFSEDVIYRQPDMLSALHLAVQVSGLDEKQIYLPLGLDKAQWSRILSGHAHFPTNKWEQLISLLDNEIPLIWLAHRLGKGLHNLEDAKDKTIREQGEKIAELQREIATLVKYGVISKAAK